MVSVTHEPPEAMGRPKKLTASNAPANREAQYGLRCWGVPFASMYPTTGSRVMPSAKTTGAVVAVMLPRSTENAKDGALWRTIRDIH